MKINLELAPKDVSDAIFLQFMQAVWAQFVELAPDELKTTPTFLQFAADLLQLEEAIVTDPLSVPTARCNPEERQQQIADTRHQILLTYEKLIKELTTQAWRMQPPIIS